MPTEKPILIKLSIDQALFLDSEGMAASPWITSKIADILGKEVARNGEGGVMAYEVPPGEASARFFDAVKGMGEGRGFSGLQLGTATSRRQFGHFFAQLELLNEVITTMKKAGRQKRLLITPENITKLRQSGHYSRKQLMLMTNIASISLKELTNERDSVVEKMSSLLNRHAQLMAQSVKRAQKSGKRVRAVVVMAPTGVALERNMEFRRTHFVGRKPPLIRELLNRSQFKNALQKRAKAERQRRKK